jgi:helix-turn-helix protein
VTVAAIRMTSPDTLYVTCKELHTVIIPVQPARRPQRAPDGAGDRTDPQTSGGPESAHPQGLARPQRVRAAGIGVTLAAARLRAGLTLEDVAATTRIKVGRLVEFENDDYSGCGATVFARGRLSAIARAVGLDPAPLLAVFDASLEPGPSAAATRPNGRPITEPSTWTLVLLGASALAAIYPVTLLVVAVLGGG